MDWSVTYGTKQACVGAAKQIFYQEQRVAFPYHIVLSTIDTNNDLRFSYDKKCQALLYVWPWKRRGNVEPWILR